MSKIIGTFRPGMAGTEGDGFKSEQGVIPTLSVGTGEGAALSRCNGKGARRE